MSNWTHITACIYLETCIQSKDIEQVVREILQKAPKITGSEGDADVFVNALSGYNLLTCVGCGLCPFEQSRRKTKEGLSICNAPEEYQCKAGEPISYQQSVAITIIGDLRDRVKSQTKIEYDDFIKWLKQRFSIRLKTCNIKENV